MTDSTSSIDYKKLGFNYVKTKCFVMYKWSDGKWDSGKICRSEEHTSELQSQ